MVGARESVEGLGDAFVVELSVEGEAIARFEYYERAGWLGIQVRPDLPDRERRSIELLRAVEIEGKFSGTATGEQCAV